MAFDVNVNSRWIVKLSDTLSGLEFEYILRPLERQAWVRWLGRGFTQEIERRGGRIVFTQSQRQIESDAQFERDIVLEHLVQVGGSGFRNVPSELTPPVKEFIAKELAHHLRAVAAQLRTVAIEEAIEAEAESAIDLSTLIIPSRRVHVPFKWMGLSFALGYDWPSDKDRRAYERLVAKSMQTGVREVVTIPPVEQIVNMAIPYVREIHGYERNGKALPTTNPSPDDIASIPMVHIYETFRYLMDQLLAPAVGE